MAANQRHTHALEGVSKYMEPQQACAGQTCSWNFYNGNWLPW